MKSYDSIFSEGNRVNEMISQHQCDMYISLQVNPYKRFTQKGLRQRSKTC